MFLEAVLKNRADLASLQPTELAYSSLGCASDFYQGAGMAWI